MVSSPFYGRKTKWYFNRQFIILRLTINRDTACKADHTEPGACKADHTEYGTREHLMCTTLPLVTTLIIVRIPSASYGAQYRADA